MTTRFKGICLFVIFIILASSCRKDGIGGLPSDAASLTVSVGLPSITLDTRAREMYSSDNESNYGKIVSDPFATDLTGWSDYEKLIDAREIYRLTLLLIDRVDGVLVGYRDLYNGSDDMRSSDAKEGANGWLDGTEVVTDAEYGTQVKVTFNYDNPMHQPSGHSSLECLERGLYRMIVVANWSPLTMSVTDKEGNVINRTYPGLKDKSNNDEPFETYVKSVLTQYMNQGGTSPLKFSGSDSEYTDYHKFMDFAIHSSDSDFLCTLGPQPLTLIQDFELQPGMNHVSGQLKRTWARLRVAVENISQEELTIHDISFGDSTTRNYSFLFVNPADERGSFKHPNKDTKHGAPNIFHVSDNEPDGQYTNPYNALISTKKETTIKGLGSGNTKILFDGYILDSDSHDIPFTYNLDIEYVGKSVKKLKRAKNSDGDWAVNKSSPDDVEDGGLYVIQNQTSSKRILYAGNGQLETALLANDGHGNLKDQDYYFEPVQVFRFIRTKDENGNGKSETVTNKYGDRPNEEQSYPVFHIQTYDELYYLGAPQENKYATNLELESNVKGSDLSAYNSFVVRNDGFRIGPTNDPDKYKDERYLCFYSTEPNSQNGNRDFINVNGDSNKQDQVNGWSDNDAGSEFYLHKVAEVTEGAHYVGTITLSTIDPDTAVSTPVSTIYRNDFINILIVASFNEKTGELDFKVKDWNKGGGNIEFN